MRRGRPLVLVLLCLASSVLVPCHDGVRAPRRLSTAVVGPDTKFGGSLGLDVALLGEPGEGSLELQVSTRPGRDVDGAVFRVLVPDHWTLQGGPPSWEENLRRDQEVTRRFTVTGTLAGEGAVVAVRVLSPGRGLWVEARAVAGAAEGFRPRANGGEAEEPVATTVVDGPRPLR